MTVGCRTNKELYSMKMFKIYALAVSLLMLMSACGNDNKGDNGKTPSNNGVSLGNIEKEWKLVSVNDVEPEFSIYMWFDSGIVGIYQQLYSLDYLFYEGDYSIDGNVISGSYIDGSLWKCSYEGSLSEDGTTLTLVSRETNPITCVYKECTIPQFVIDEATTRSSYDFVYHL